MITCISEWLSSHNDIGHGYGCHQQNPISWKLTILDLCVTVLFVHKERSVGLTMGMSL